MIAQVHQSGGSTPGGRPRQRERPGGDPDHGTQSSVTRVQVLERHIERQEDDDSQDAGSVPQDLFEDIDFPVG